MLDLSRLQICGHTGTDRAGVKLLKFHYHTLLLYSAVCALGNHTAWPMPCAATWTSPIALRHREPCTCPACCAPRHDLLIDIHLSPTLPSGSWWIRVHRPHDRGDEEHSPSSPDEKKSTGLPGIGLSTPSGRWCSFSLPRVLSAHYRRLSV